MANFHRDKKFGGGRGGQNFGGRDFKKPAMMHPAVCDECGNSCEVPFKPMGEKPVYCSQCFNKGNGGGNSERSERRDYGERNFRGRDSNRSPMHQAICSECGDDCEVPFKPSQDKPVYCSQCFGKGKNSGNKNDEQSKKQFELLNEKLDKILKMLASAPTVKPAQKEILEKLPENIQGGVLEELEIPKPKKALKKAVTKKVITKKAKKE